MTSARHCPACDALGILRLDQPHGAHGQIADPTLLCPRCGTEFPATGITWLGASRPPVEGSDEELEAWADSFVDQLLGPEE